MPTTTPKIETLSSGDSGWRVPDFIVVGMLTVLLLRGGDNQHPHPPVPDPKPSPVNPVDPDNPVVPPAPDPTVTKVPKGSFLVIVEASEDRSKFPFLASLQKDVKFWRSLTERGYYSSFLDSELDEAIKYKKDWEKVGLPAFLCITPNGDVPVAIPCPPNTDFMEQYLLP